MLKAFTNSLLSIKPEGGDLAPRTEKTMDKVKQNAELLNRYVAVSMEIRKEELKDIQDFKRWEELRIELSDLRIEILTRMM